jgi:integrase
MHSLYTERRYDARVPSVEMRALRDGSRRYFVRLRDPKRGKYTSETFTSRAEAERFCRLVEAIGPARAIAERAEEVGSGSPVTLDEVMDGYLKWNAKRVRSDRTIADYSRDYRNWIAPTFGARKADAVTEDDVQRWVEEMSGSLSPKSVADRHAILHAAYKWGIRNKAVTTDPCLATVLPKRHRKAVKGIRPPEWIALHTALRQINPDAADLAEFLLGTGWRFSEATALSAYDVEDYGDGQVWVTMGQVVRRNAAGQHVVVQDAKSEKSQRRSRLSPKIATLVQRRLEKVEGDAPVFTTARGAQWHYSNFANRAWKPACKAANLTRNPTPHWLRHSHIVWLDRTGKVSLPELQRRAGHESIETTVGVYGSMIEDVNVAALEAFDAMLGDEQPQIMP